MRSNILNGVMITVFLMSSSFIGAIIPLAEIYLEENCGTVDSVVEI